MSSNIVDELSNVIRTVDGGHTLGASALAEALQPWLTEHDRQARTAALLDAASAVNTKASWLEILSRSDAPIMREKFARWLRELERLGHPSSCNCTPCTGSR